MPSRSVLRHTGLGTATIEQCPLPQPLSGEIRVKVVAVALNPIDWKMLHRQALPDPTVWGATLVGDRVAGMTQGGNTLSPDDGAFAEYVVAKAHALIHLPKSLSPELGSTLPTALFTAGFCLYRHLSLAYPGEAEAIQSTQPVVFIYGGGTAIGSMQVQLAKLSGLRVISACSLESFDFVKQCGADVVVDYRDPSCAKSVVEASKGRQLDTVDCISNDASSAICAAAMEPAGGTYRACTMRGPAIINSQVVTTRIVAFAVLGKEFYLDAHSPPFPVVQYDVDFLEAFVVRAERLVEEGKIRPIPADIREGELAAIVDGLVDLKMGRVSSLFDKGAGKFAL